MAQLAFSLFKGRPESPGKTVWFSFCCCKPKQVWKEKQKPKRTTCWLRELLPIWYKGQCLGCTARSWKFLLRKEMKPFTLPPGGRHRRSSDHLPFSHLGLPSSSKCVPWGRPDAPSSQGGGPIPRVLAGHMASRVAKACTKERSQGKQDRWGARVKAAFSQRIVAWGAFAELGSPCQAGWLREKCTHPRGLRPTHCARTLWPAPTSGPAPAPTLTTQPGWLCPQHLVSLAWRHRAAANPPRSALPGGAHGQGAGAGGRAAVEAARLGAAAAAREPRARLLAADVTGGPSWRVSGGTPCGAGGPGCPGHRRAPCARFSGHRVGGRRRAPGAPPGPYRRSTGSRLCRRSSTDVTESFLKRLYGAWSTPHLPSGLAASAWALRVPAPAQAAAHSRRAAVPGAGQVSRTSRRGASSGADLHR